MSPQEKFKEGLEDIVAGTSSICFIDGKLGRLVYRGYDIKDLVKGSFEETIFLLWKGKLPTVLELEDFKKELKSHRKVNPDILKHLCDLPRQGHPMDHLRTAVSINGIYNKTGSSVSEAEENLNALRLTAKFPTFVAAIYRFSKGLSPVDPRDDLDHADNFLYMMFGERQPDLSVKAMDMGLVLHADHEFNASTFSAREIASTMSDMYSAVTGAIGALKGPLHGGANEAVMKMLIEIGNMNNIEPWLAKARSEKRKIMGFGHRVYKTKDPRAEVLEGMSEQIGIATKNRSWFDMSRVIESYMLKSEKPIYPNVDFYSASMYYQMGIPFELFTPIFAVSRIAGWSTHVLEQHAKNRIIRPAAEYTGPESLPYLPIVER
jgi:citrate synthase